MQRRSFLGAMLTAMAAPAIVRSTSLMKMVVPSSELILSTEWQIPKAITFEESFLAAGRLSVGDVITISGIAGIFTITSETTMHPRPSTNHQFNKILQVGRA